MKSLLPPALQAGWSVRDTKTRRERLAELAFAGYRIPRFGSFPDMKRLGVPLVVYTDELAHCGEGKVLWKPGDPNDGFEAFDCSKYVPDAGDGDGVVVSRRELVVGDLSFTIVYTSRASWMSNVDGDYYHSGVFIHFDRQSDQLLYPMYSIDYTRNAAGEAYHFDLNTCPGVPLGIVNMVGRDVLTESVAKFCRDRWLI